MQRKHILIEHNETAHSQRSEQIKKTVPQKKKRQPIASSKGSCYEKKPIKYLKDGTLFKTSEKSKVWWKVQSQTACGKYYTVATSTLSGRTVKFAKKGRYVFTKRFKSACNG